jgi:ABC-type polysaccharide/polyol phosphate transport system ATPase subunit
MRDLQHSLQRAAFGLDEAGARAPGMPKRTDVLNGPVQIEVRDVHKTFRIPDHDPDSARARLSHPLSRTSFRELRALRGISFDVHQGEFFGIVGRNGSGKSTLLKILASIYRAEHGRVRMAGRLAPFIELGVGFNMELTARENVVLNGVMMGLTRHQAAHRLDTILEFAELRDYTDLKLKNYSSGMLVRLAFSTMVQADADIMLIDEVLAVGDASFAQKCLDVFREKRRTGTTLVLVTHDMATVQAFCDRALLIHDGEQRYLGDPEEAALRYYRLNFGADVSSRPGDPPPAAVPDVNVKLLEVWLANDAGERVENVEQDKPFTLGLLAESRHELAQPVFNFHCLNEDGVWVFAFSKAITDESGAPLPMAAGEQVRITAQIENPLVPGRYSLECWISRARDEQGNVALHVLKLLDFFVYGTRPGAGSVHAQAEVDAVIEQ